MENFVFEQEKFSLDLKHFRWQQQQQQQQEQQQVMQEDLQQQVEILKGNSFTIPDFAFWKVMLVVILSTSYFFFTIPFMAVILIFGSNILYKLLFLPYFIFGTNINFW